MYSPKTLLDTKEVSKLKKNFYLPRSYDISKGQGAIDDLNNLLECVGVQFTVSKKHNGLKLFIDVDEEKLKKSTTSKNLGRPVEHEFSIEQVQKMKADGKTNKQIYTELHMSKSLFYKHMKEYKGHINGDL